MSTLPQVETASTELRLPVVLRRQLAQFVESAYPYEACGLLLGRAGDNRMDAIRITSARNLNRTRPKDRYLLDPRDFLAADRTANAHGLEIVGIWHSHPNNPARPSRTDLEGAWEGYSYLIISTTAESAQAFRSWRLVGDRFLEEAVEPEDSEP